MDPEFNNTLKVNKGIEQPPLINPNISLKRKQKYTVDDYFTEIRKGNRIVLSQAITLIESTNLKHQIIAQKIIEKCLPFCGRSIRIGITGVPGVGKSTFIEAIGNKIIRDGHHLAVLAIDPSSEKTKGSILGDKTRMESLSINPNAFIRPTPSMGSLGGVANKTRETTILCEAAGFDIVFIETVGVGQSETAVFSMVDFFLLLMLAGAGDELQGIKRGIMEMADAVVITKADGNNSLKSDISKTDFKNALHLFPPSESGWKPQVLTCSAKNDVGIEDVWKMILKYTDFTLSNGYFNKNRNFQAKEWMYDVIDEGLKNSFYNESRKTRIKQMEDFVVKGTMSSYMAAQLLLKEYYNH